MSNKFGQKICLYDKTNNTKIISYDIYNDIYYIKKTCVTLGNEKCTFKISFLYLKKYYEVRIRII